MGIRLYKKNGKKTIESCELKGIFDNWKGASTEEGASTVEAGEEEHWLFVSPHDDDIMIAAGILLQKAVEENVHVTILITTDGSMGYCNSRDMDNIVAIRRKETLDSFSILGITDVLWLDFPDNQLGLYAGKRKAKPDDPCVISGFTGLQNAYTHYFRKLRPTRIFVPSGADLHPDHKITYQETLISLFHCTSLIWPELGESLPEIPALYEMAVYCDFSEMPDIKVEGCDAELEVKLNGILVYRSQEKIITSLVEKLKSGGPVEYFRDVKFKFYSPENYRDLF